MMRFCTVRLSCSCLRVAVLVLLAGLPSGCAQFPELDALPAPDTGAPPALLPLDGLLAAAKVPDTARAAGEALSARAARLKARAAAMRGPVHDPATRARLQAAIAAGAA